MTASPVDTKADLHAIIAALCAERDAAISEKAALAEALAKRNNEFGERIEHQAATIDVLKAMSASPSDPQPVFDLIVERARDLCGAYGATVYEFDGTLIHYRAATGVSDDATVREQVAALYPMLPTRASPAARAILHRRIIRIDDLEGEPDLYPILRRQTAKSAVIIPLMRGDVAMGALALGSRERAGFSNGQIDLLKTFAEQAVIAISSAETYRALQGRTSDLQEALEQQTATADILRVISSSPTDVQPTFDAIAESATTLCGAASGGVFRFDGSLIHPVAQYGLAPDELEAVRRIYPQPPGRGGVTARAVLTCAVVHVADTAADPEYGFPGIVQSGLHTALSVPMLHDGKPIGAITVTRREVAPFSKAQVELLRTFADQALIAIENVRLFVELRDRTNELAQRQAELRVIFENMGDGVALFDETRHLVASNKRFQDMLDVPDGVISSRPAFADYIRYLADRGEYGPDPEDHVQNLLAFGSQPIGFERTRPNGRILEIRGNPVPGGGFVVIYSDITERKRNEEELLAARDAAEEASRSIETAYRELKTAQASLIQAEKMASLGQLTAGIAHEIKNPLNFVNNFAALSVDLLEELKETATPGFAALTEKQRAEIEDVSAMLTSNLEKITEHGKRADGIVKAMLDHSRGSSGERRMVDLNALIDEALNLAYHGARAQDQSFNIALERHFAAGMAPIELAPQDMTRVFLNLFSNGFYAATRQGQIGADAGFMPTLKITTSDSGEAIEVRVRDNGIGIPAEIQDKLFQPFFTTKPTGEGTGLGLSITYDIVTKQHGGSIAVDSKVGEYSEFTIRLPCNP